MASDSSFSLDSTATAIALILPPSQSTDVNAIRSVHDRAFHKWPPHINVLYPCVRPEQLTTVVPILREALRQTSAQPPSITLDRIGTFTHRKNATIFLQPSDESEVAISELRSRLVGALGLSDSAGTHDGSFRPHLTLGQASLKGPVVDRLIQKCTPVTGVQWIASEFAVLRRKSSGEMEVVDHISLQGEDSTSTGQKEFSEHAVDSSSVWSPCFHYSSNHSWVQHQITEADSQSERQPLSVLSYNLLADTFGCSFDNRLPLIIDTIKTTTRQHLSEVLCLQEISNGMLADLLEHPFIQQRYPFCSHAPSSVLANYLNLVTLSTTPFNFTFHHFEERHKSALVVRPCSSPFQIANIHLTAALKDNMVAAKQRQIASLTSFLSESTKHNGRLPVIAGDFNLATSPITIQYALKRGDISFATSIAVRALVDPDIWSDAFVVSSDTGDAPLNDEDGATFDVQINPLAAESNAPADQRPQRYDRILFRRTDALAVDDFRIFGRPDQDGQCGSDHFGIAAVLRVPSGRQEGAEVIPDPSDRPFIHHILDDTDLFPHLLPFLPTQQDRDKRIESISRLTKILTSDARLSDIAIVPLGSYALGTYFADSDVDVLVIGSLPPTAFFNIASSRLSSIIEGFRGVHYINSLVPVIEVEINGIKFDVQYCQAPQILAQRSVSNAFTDSLVTDDLAAVLPPAVMRPLNTYRDTAYLLRTVSCIEAFQAAHRYLSLYLRHRGLYSAKFGYLGGVHLSLMLNHVIKRLDPTIVASVTAASLVRTFVEYYSDFDWTSAIVFDPNHPHHDYRRTSREPILILAIHSPTARPNVASSCSRLTARSLTNEFKLATDKLRAGNWSWMLRSPDAVLGDFTTNFGAFIVITIDMWDLHKFGQSSQRDFFGNVESRTPALMVNLSRIEGVHGQAWPFRLGSVQDEVEVGKQLKAFYIIGVAAPANLDAADRRLLQSKVLQASQSCEASIRQSESYDERHIWTQVEVVSRKKVLEYKLHFTAQH